jgi:hypothetical protein
MAPRLTRKKTSSPSIKFLSDAGVDCRVLHCAVNQRHIRRSQPTRDAALKDACSQLLQGHAVNRIVGPNETISAERIKDWCEKDRLEQRGSQAMGASKAR